MIQLRLIVQINLLVQSPVLVRRLLKLQSPLGSHDTEPSSQVDLEGFDVYVKFGSESLDVGTGASVVATVEEVDEFDGGESVEALVGSERGLEV